MKTLSWWAIVSGVVFAALTFAVMPYLRWDATRVLSQFDGQKFVPDMMEAAEEEFRVPIAVTRLHSCLSVLAGVLMLKRKRAGWFLWLALGGISVATAIFDLAREIAIHAAVFRGIWWAVVLWISWTTVKKKAQSYWTSATASAA
ncbi:MAG: hypothetical protein QM760_07480 [Nibricoccus sp.]